jgi:hypothetical protein
MKYVVLVISLAIGSLALLHTDTVFGIWVPESPQELLNDSATIFVGNITSVHILKIPWHFSYLTEENGIDKTVIKNYTLILDQYQVSIEKFLKSPQKHNTITVRQPVTSLGPGVIGGLDKFKVGDRVLFYIQHLDGNNTYAPESFLIPQSCTGNDVLMLPRFELGNEFFTSQNGKRLDDNYTAGVPIQFVWNQDTRTLDGKSYDVLVWITKTTTNGTKTVFSKTIHTGSKPCQWVASAKWEFIPQQGKYRMDLKIKENDTITAISNSKFSVISGTKNISPLGQFKSGISASKIQCPYDLELVIKSSDGTPACLKLSTAQKLAGRGWAILTGETTTADNLSYNAIPSCVSHIDKQYASAGPIGGPLCPFAYYSTSGKIINSSGFYGIYNYATYPGISNYILEPGHNATITYLLSLDSINTDVRIPEYPDGENIFNDVEFMHDAGMHNHPGITVSSSPGEQVIRERHSAAVSIMISASSDAPHGIYWVHLPPGVCFGGDVIILTITDCAK